MRAITSALTAKLIISAVALGVSLGFAAAQQEPYPGQHNHAEPPADYFCEHVTADKAHRCDCPGMQKDPLCKKPPDADDQDDVTVENEGESAKCLSYCWKDHCHCRQACDT